VYIDLLYKYIIEFDSENWPGHQVTTRHTAVVNTDVAVGLKW